MAAGPTYEPIAQYTLTGTQSSVSFTSIPQTYTDLVVSIHGRSTIASADSIIFCQLNGVTSSSYGFKRFGSSGTSGYSDGSYSSAYMYMGRVPGNSATASYFSDITVNVNDYTATKYPQLFSSSFMPTTAIEYQAGSFFSASNVVSILFYLESSSSWAIGSQFSLYGIKAA
jgi:hypothetical protein